MLRCSTVVQRGWHARRLVRLVLLILACGPLDNGVAGAAEVAPSGDTEVAHDQLVLARAIDVDLPVREHVWFEAGSNDGLAYAFTLAEGHRIVVEVGEAFAGTLTLDYIGVDLDGTTTELESLEFDDGGHRAERSGRYLLHIDPEPDWSGSAPIEVRKAPSLTFPVRGKNAQAIQSFFGAPRERGRRSHHGVDIFAARGTETVAATAGFVAFVGVNRLGGNVVFLRDATYDYFYYYAHLQDASVSTGQWVEAGDPIGRVGTSGNARGGSPHLHFGIYRHGPIDPLPFVHDRVRSPVPVTAETTQLGELMRTKARTFARETPNEKARSVLTLERGAAARPIAIRGSWYRVRLPDGREGWVAPRRLQAVERPLSVFRTEVPIPLFVAPLESSTIATTLPAGTDVEVLARSGDAEWVRANTGETGWRLAPG